MDGRLIIAESRSSELCDLSLHIYKDVDKRNVAQGIKAVFFFLAFWYLAITSLWNRSLALFFSPVSSLMYHHTHIITRWKGNTFSKIKKKSYVTKLLSSVILALFTRWKPAQITHFHCSGATLHTHTGELLCTATQHRRRTCNRSTGTGPGLSSLLKGFSLVVTDGGERTSCSSRRPDTTSGDLGVKT